MSIKDQIVNELNQLTPQQQQELLDYAKRLGTKPPGTPGKLLLAHMHDFQFEPGAVDEMMLIIEEGCERIDWDGWQ